MSRQLKCIRAPFAGAVCAITFVQCACAQHKSYSDYYRQNPGIRTGAPGTNAYLYDKYFYHSPGISPYLNLGRAGNDAADSYHLYVKPELERRRANTIAQAQYVQQRKLQGNIGHTEYPGAGYIGGTPANSQTEAHADELPMHTFARLSFFASVCAACSRPVCSAARSTADTPCVCSCALKAFTS